MDDYLLVFLEPPVHCVPADTYEALCEPVLVQPNAVHEHTEPHVFGRKTPGRQAVLLVEHLDVDAVDDDLARAKARIRRGNASRYWMPAEGMSKLNRPAGR
jgi:hypothetical protein